MRKLTTLFLMVCIAVAVGCSDSGKIKSNLSVNSIQDQVKLSIEEAGGTPDRTEAGISDFLKVASFQGQYSTISGYAGFKVKNGKLYKVVASKWKEVPTANIAVDKNLKKLQIEENGQVAKVYTFDDYGYYIFENGVDEMATYFTKYDLIENYQVYYLTYTGYGYTISIDADGNTSLRVNGYLDWITAFAQLQGNALTVKGSAWPTISIVFESDGKTSTWYQNGSKLLQAWKQ